MKICKNIEKLKKKTVINFSKTSKNWYFFLLICESSSSFNKSISWKCWISKSLKIYVRYEKKFKNHYKTLKKYQLWNWNNGKSFSKTIKKKPSAKKFFSLSTSPQSNTWNLVIMWKIRNIWWISISTYYKMRIRRGIRASRW